ncbi:TPA: aminoacyl-tRNA hydrolase [Bacillus thuringiensis]|jgi:PTH1 family peptidyl-tRNA hydrolase|uniref:Peptidyl-tRNA hydrolase n=5 Tax=Bacillus TaxID=1386 RepID=J9A1M8_9BACI|nr:MULTISPECIES: aminoacyl-tRNA hydrolase [Bacillus]KAA0742574.1 aminoacyl-tRNA hydrolase [Bacillus sp. AY3-1]KAA0768051.1 aminoacyl-tRNA hydrolase [Bacillus sp. BB51/4]KAA0781563.1 aminoacyl-tRNA hydrolase [Bacillus sp. BPN334]KAA0792370.1 aminoacyl-tRNA hydrolase [Bacillus sp. BB081]KLA31005.1 Peptidyl-tRNA hydrolase [Bacillus cereus]MBY7115202.1 aminoacyl-tRNA hydrolase [Bacillus sp. 17RED48]MBY7125874.1 aminoacyl-tRNA hydrolase [Bacillus sp. 16GRE42]MCR6844796.1 aminoacyl-tRNA hydrolase
MRRNQDWLRLFVSKKESSGTRMKLIVGLGNPGREYELTRHNIGFMAIDELAKRWNISLNEQKFKGIFGAGFVNGEKVILLKPLTYMNLSGESIRPLMDYYKIDVEDFVVLYDDLDIPVGKLRLRMKGSAGGHNGVKSTISHLGTQEFQRIRMGIDRPKNGMKVVDYVLGRFTSEEIPDVSHSIEKAADACEEWLNKPFLQIMNTFNS